MHIINVLKMPVCVYLLSQTCLSPCYFYGKTKDICTCTVQYCKYLEQNRNGLDIDGVKRQNVFSVTLECIDDTCT